MIKMERPPPKDAKKTLIPIDQEGCFCLGSHMCPTIQTYTFTLQYSIIEHMDGWIEFYVDNPNFTKISSI